LLTLAMLKLDNGLVSESMSCCVMPYDENEARCILCGCWLGLGEGAP
jgi:hypothetical protein